MERTLFEDERDLLDATAVGRLPAMTNIIFMAGRKFGTTGSEGLTWAMNALVPGNVARRFKGSRIVVFSTGCVYPLGRPAEGGCSEDRAPDPVGEYAASCLARERIFSYYAELYGTAVTILRLNYAIDLRYGVLHDIATRIWEGAPVSLGVPAVNVIWQGDVNNRALLCLAHCANPPRVINVTGPERVSVRSLALGLGELLGRKVEFGGEEGELALLADSSRAVQLFGYPSIGLRAMMEWTARWVASGGRSCATTSTPGRGAWQWGCTAPSSRSAFRSSASSGPCSSLPPRRSMNGPGKGDRISSRSRG